MNEQAQPDSTLNLINIRNIQRNGLVENITEQLMELMITKELMPGMELPSESELGEMFGVGKSSVREALRSLSALDVVEIRHGKKALVKYPSAAPMEKVFRFVVFCTRSGLDDILELRNFLESEAAELAAQRRTEEQLEKIGKALDNFVSAVDKPTEEFIESDMIFHLSIAESVDNIILTYILRAYRSVMKESIKRLFIPLEERDPEGLLNRHINIYKCIEDKDPVGARRAMETHFHVSGLVPKRD